MFLDITYKNGLIESINTNNIDTVIYDVLTLKISYNNQHELGVLLLDEIEDIHHVGTWHELPLAIKMAAISVNKSQDEDKT